MVNRYPVSNGLLIIRTAEQHDAFNLKNLHVVMAEDFDNVAARISELEAALAIVTQDRDTLLAMTGTTIEQVAARIRSAQETPVAHSKSQQKRIEAMTAPETPEKPLSDGEVRVVYEHGEPNGVRDTTGYLCHFHRVTKWPGQDERYREELALRARQADAIAAALGAVTETSVKSNAHTVCDPDDHMFSGPANFVDAPCMKCGLLLSEFEANRSAKP